MAPVPVMSPTSIIEIPHGDSVPLTSVDSVRHFKLLRAIFVTSLSLQIALKFLPAYRDDSQTYSSFEATQYSLANDPIGGMIVLSLWILNILLIYWSFKKPQRWFLSSCCYLDTFRVHFVGGLSGWLSPLY